MAIVTKSGEVIETWQEAESQNKQLTIHQEFMKMFDTADKDMNSMIDE